MRVPLLLTALAVVVLGCHGGSPPAPHLARVVPPGTAHLPAAPDLDPPQAPERHPDGAYSVRGLFAAGRKDLADDISVRGTVAVLHTCALTEKVCKPAPYLHLTDAKTGQGRRLLVGGERDLDARKFQTGQEVVVRGRFSSGSEDGTYYAPQGMLLLSPLPPPDADATSGGADAR